MVRAACPEDRATPALLYLSSRPYYDAYTGSERRSRRVLEAIWPRRGHTAGYDACQVAVLGDAVAGACVAFPAEDGDALARRFLSLTLVRLPPWQLPHVLRHLRASADVMPVPPARSLYIDALAVDPAQRRRGVATALLDDAANRACGSGLRGVSLDTGLENKAAQALYEGYGFVAHAEHHVRDARAAAAIGGPGFISYFKAL